MASVPLSRVIAAPQSGSRSKARSRQAAELASRANGVLGSTCLRSFSVSDSQRLPACRRQVAGDVRAVLAADGPSSTTSASSINERRLEKVMVV